MIFAGDQLPPIEVDYVLLTPDLAEEYLTHNTGNRRERPVKQAGMVRDQLAGAWLQTGESIKFDWTDRMIDGQNRCQAVITSGASIPILVIRGLSPEAQGVMDSGAPRTSSDALHFAGVDNAKAVNSIANIHRAWKRGGLPHAGSIFSGSSRMTNQETVEYARRYPEIETAAIASKSFYSRGLRLPVGAIGTAVIELSKLNAEACDDFFQRIIDVRTDGFGDPIATLIKRVNDLKKQGATIRVHEAAALFMLFRTWNAYRAEERVTKLLLGSNENGWNKIPEPRW